MQLLLPVNAQAAAAPAPHCIHHLCSPSQGFNAFSAALDSCNCLEPNPQQCLALSPGFSGNFSLLVWLTQC